MKYQSRKELGTANKNFFIKLRLKINEPLEESFIMKAYCLQGTRELLLNEIIAEVSYAYDFLNLITFCYVFIAASQ